MNILYSKYINIKKCSIHDGYSINSVTINVSDLSEVNMENNTIHDIYSETKVIYILYK